MFVRIASRSSLDLPARFLSSPVCQWIFIFLLIIPLPASASGPVAPEIESFSPPGQVDLVDHFTGDFRYSIPLMDVPGPNGGYPIALSYANGITPDQDASWVGLGWSLNPGGIVRQMRGIPDDFKGVTRGDTRDCGTASVIEDDITTTQSIKPNFTFGISTAGNYEFFGADSSVGTGLTMELKAYFDNYKGFGISHMSGLSGQTKSSGIAGGVGVNFTRDSLEGNQVAAQASLSLKDKVTLGADLSFDPYRGLTGLSGSIGYRYAKQRVVTQRADLTNFLGYAKPASLPAISRDMSGDNIQMSFKGGGDVYGNYFNGSLGGFYNVERLKCQVVKTAAVGFLHLDEAGEYDSLDFNRERDGPIYDNSPNLAIPVLTNDFFVASGRDVTGTFRAYRNDVPAVFDPHHESSMTGGAVGMDIGSGNLIKGGVYGALNHSSTVIKGWDGGNENAVMKAPPNVFLADVARERTYFKFIGEFTAQPGPTATEPIRVPLRQLNFNAKDTPPKYFEATAVDLKPPDSTARMPRASLIEAYTYKDLVERSKGLAELAADYETVRADTFRRPNHIGAFRITTPTGLRYVYGLASYNKKFEEHKYSVSREQCSSQTATTNPQRVWCTTLTTLPGASSNQPAAAIYNYQDSSAGTSSDELLEVKSVSPYASTYMLTAVIGTDYIDTDDVPGPSDGDYGYWVRFHYERAPDFKWRTPYGGASFVRGPENGRFASGKEDLRDYGYLTYGERESWYLSSVETATHQAYFCVNKTARTDALAASGAAQSAGGTSAEPKPWRLDSVRLYTKVSLGPNTPANCQDLPGHIQPATEAHMEYDQSLQKGAANQDTGSGKLTLKKAWFSYYGNTRGQLSPYEFDYEDGDSSLNPNYREGDHNRWGTYQPRPVLAANCRSDDRSCDANPPLDDHTSYATQNKADADRWAAVWSLRRIVEPSGRIVRVTYEADDYGYVQDKPAMRMFPLVSVGSGLAGNRSKMSPVTVMPGGALPKVFFALDSPITCTGATDCSAAIRRAYVGDHKQVFFKIRVALRTDKQSAPFKWQTVSGYTGVTGAGIESANVGWIQLAPVVLDPPGPQYHPLAHAAWQYLRLEQPELIRDGGINGDPNGNAFDEALKVMSLVEMIPEIIDSFQAVYGKWSNAGYGQTIDLGHSYVRLQDPDGIKIGGGTRVKRITLRDSWASSTNQQGSDLETGYEYSYQLEDGRSAGVAAYEPMTGGEENPLRDAFGFTQGVLLTSSYNLFSERPIGEALYPAPLVGYSRVVRRSLAAIHDQVTHPTHPTSVGPTVYEFYTARDFPVRQTETPIEKHRNPDPHLILIPLLGSISLNSVTASQGYTTIANNMHGKPKRETSYEYVGNAVDPSTKDYRVRQEPVRETTYHYLTIQELENRPLDLKNYDVPVTAPTFQGGVSWPGERRTVGENSDMVIDWRLNQTQSWDGGLNINVDVFLVAIYPVVIPVPIPNFGYSLSEAKTVVTSRMIHRAGILDSLTVRERSAKYVTKNLLYDPLLGSAVISATDNAYGDPVYNYQEPAAWRYARMGAAYEEAGQSIDLTDASAIDDTHVSPPASLNACENVPTPGAPPCLSLGSEVTVDVAGGGRKLTLLRDAGGRPVFETTAGALTLNFGNKMSGHVTRSGNRNQLHAVTDSIRSLNNPLVKQTKYECRGHGELTQTDFRQVFGVLEATHTTYSENWPSVPSDVRYAGSSQRVAIMQSRFNVANAYERGALGIFRPKSDYVYVTERSASLVMQPLNLRRNGTFELRLFGPGDEPAPCADKWTQRLLRTKYTAAGFEGEVRDSLDVSLTTLYSHKGTLPIAAAYNAKREEIAFENFETLDLGTPATAEQSSEGNWAFHAATRTLCVGRLVQPCRRPSRSGLTIANSNNAHSGRQSLEVAEETTLPQTALRLEEGKRYVISAWVKQPAPYDDAALRIDFIRAKKSASKYVAIGTTIYRPTGPVIDGWQRVEGEIEVPGKYSQLLLTFVRKPRNGSWPAYFVDDLRLSPEDARLETFVYDSSTLRMRAKLDENNFSSLFGYAPDGRVESIRRETIRGVLTDSESRLHMREHP